jgi:alpha-L-fucosidase
MKKVMLFLSGLFILFSGLWAKEIVRPPMPVMPIPAARQLEWQRAELAMFVHFTVNTFTDKEWGDGTEDPDIFNPTDLDTRQWARVARDFGFKSIILTAKHHDGFCLWPSKYTDHSVTSSPWRNGKGDVVGELAKACQEFDLKMGVYLSPWDRHEPSYGDERLYNEYYQGQLRELLTQYGPICEVWFDGAKGKDAKAMEYHFNEFWGMVRQLQLGAVMFSDAGPDVRWIGNERGIAGETCWSMMDKFKVSVGKADREYLNHGDRYGHDWVPGETDVSIREGWFWHEDQHPKSLDHLLDIYFNSVGRNSVLLLNVPPNDRGLIASEDVERLKELRARLDAIFDINLSKGATLTASNIRGDADTFSPAKTLDADPDTYWATEDKEETGWLEYDFGRPITFQVVLIQEPITMGQRIEKYHVEIWTSTEWKTLTSGTTVGYKKLDRVEKVTTDKVRLFIDKSRACPLISEFGLYSE